LDDDVDPEDDGKPVASPVPAPTVVTVAPPFVPVVKVEPGVVAVNVPVHPGTILPPSECAIM